MATFTTGDGRPTRRRLSQSDHSPKKDGLLTSTATSAAGVKAGCLLLAGVIEASGERPPPLNQLRVRRDLGSGRSHKATGRVVCPDPELEEVSTGA
eukprot:1637380-Rhodomonas_salina.1